MQTERIIKMVMSAFDRWAPTYDYKVIPKLQFRGYSYTRLAELIVSALRPAPTSVLLELGIGSGILGREIAKLTPARLVGIDISREMLKIAEESTTYTLLYHCSAEDIPLTDATVDGVYSTFMLHSVMNQAKVLNEIRRVLKPDSSGVIVDLCPNLNRIPYWTLIRGNFHSFCYEYGAPSKYRPAHEYKDMLRHAGFTVRRVGRLGKQKDYTHFLFEFTKGGTDGPGCT
jgi:ubiquinone/menaquinone biosynthesis C-methylase UbiE